MATYNWTYKPNTPNKYNFGVSNTADDVKPSNCAYVATWGNDETGNGSRMKPWRTLNRTLIDLENSGQTIIFGAGVYREYIVGNINLLNYMGDGDVKFDFSYHNNWSSRYNGIGVSFTNIKFLGNGNNYIARASYKDCSLDMTANGDGSGELWINNIVSNANTSMVLFSSFDNITNNNTFHKCTNVSLSSSGTDSFLRANVYSNCNIIIHSFSALSSCQYSLFYKCNFKLTLGGTGNGTALYPSIPDGFSYFDNIEDLKEALILAASEDGVILVNPLYKCIIADPKFNNPEIGDYSLAFDSPAKNLSYFGTYVGAQGVGHALKARANEDNGDFDFDTAINVSVEDDSIRFIDDAQLASIETKVKPNLVGRELGRAPIYGSQADRNGQYIDSIGDLAATTLSAGTLLTANTPYLVEVASIVYNGSVLLAGERFTTGTELSFSSAGGGVVREITEAPQKHTLMARFSDGGATITAGTGLVAGYWYHASGSINYNGVDYVGEVFKAVDGNSFSGPGTVREAMTNQSYQHYEYGIKFTSNNFGDTRTGEIIRGNGDVDYERGIGKEFPINSRFIQIKYVMRPNNLRP